MRPEDFLVEELGSPEPEGLGEYQLVQVRKRDLTTPTLIRQLAAYYNVRRDEIGCAGYKDRQAVTSQKLSLPAALGPPPALPGLLEWQPLGLHPRPLRPGQLSGNRFTVVLQGEHSHWLETAWRRQQPVGWANYYGIQRFGPENENWQTGLAQLLEPPPRSQRARWPNNFAINSVQAELFNRYLREKVESGRFASLSPGEWVQPAVEAPAYQSDASPAEKARLLRFETATLGPVWGYKLQHPTAAELAVLTAVGLTPESFRPFRAPGSRRPVRLPLARLQVESGSGETRCRFELPAGSYASVFLEHFFQLEYE